MMYDALIIGAGPAGATTALLLARAGWRVALIEKAVFPRRKVCGEFISATTLPLLEQIGLDEAFMSLAGPEIRRVGIFAGETTPTPEAPLPAPAGYRRSWGRALGRDRLDPLLLEAAGEAGARIWQPYSATALCPIDGGHACAITSESSKVSTVLTGRIAIVAQGSWTRGILPWARPQPHKDSDLIAFKAHFINSDLPADLMPLLVFPGGYGGMATSDSGRVSLSCCIRRDALENCRGRWPGRAAGDAVFQHIQLSSIGVRQSLKRAYLDGAWLSTGPIRPGIRTGYANGVFLVGNIAGESHPLIAEGISMAMQGAHLLARHLIAQQDNLAPEAQQKLGAKYTAEWKACFAPRIYAAELFARLTVPASVAAITMPMVAGFPGILTIGSRIAGKAQVCVVSARG
ncbi:MAG: NAD(P)/FAD-dependent oxidoreductase [Methylocystis sp.]